MEKFLFAILYLLSLQVYAGSQDEDFLAAHEAFLAGNSARLDSFARKLKHHVLEPYLGYWQLKLRLEEADPESVKQFLDHYQGGLLADRLRGEWLKLLGKKQQWELFGSEYPALVNEDTELTCYALQRRLRLNDNGALSEARPLWFTGKDLPESCTPLFDALIIRRLISAEDVWARIRLALEENHVGVVKKINQNLPDNQMIYERQLDLASHNPLRYLEQYPHNMKSRAARELVLFALNRLARTSAQQAHQHWKKLRKEFSEADRGYFWGRLAYQAAHKHQPEALRWFKEAGPLNDQQLAWKTRAALRELNWIEVLASIEAMSALEQREGAWRYWKARALKELGKTMEAEVILKPLSQEHNFYGQLAGEELGVVTTLPPESYKPGADEVKTAEQLPGIQRALALYRMSLRPEANQEWIWAIRGFDDRQLLAAAELARRHEIWDRAINTADKTLQLHDFSLRYLAPYREKMQDYTRQLDLDEAWVYGVIRQESRFIPDARSSAGASGLMQLMPATARWAAKRAGIKDYRWSLVNELDTNVSLGTFYLKHVLTNLENHPLLASAAYNAGPGRAWQWRGLQPMEGAVYAETIPFNETRDYVKKVMSNAMYYARIFGQQFLSLKQRLGVISPRRAGDQLAGDVP